MYPVCHVRVSFSPELGPTIWTLSKDITPHVRQLATACRTVPLRYLKSETSGTAGDRSDCSTTVVPVATVASDLQGPSGPFTPEIGPATC